MPGEPDQKSCCAGRACAVSALPLFVASSRAGSMMPRQPDLHAGLSMPDPDATRILEGRQALHLSQVLDLFAFQACICYPRPRRRI